jgi:hypothetical protein
METKKGAIFPGENHTSFKRIIENITKKVKQAPKGDCAISPIMKRGADCK